MTRQPKDPPAESFVARWSRRKQGVDEGDGLAPRSANDRSEAKQDLETLPDEEILSRLSLKDPDSLEPGDDFSAFMRAEVPTRLRNRALRRLWAGNPVLANLDGLVDYGEDFTDAARVLDNLKTAYEVGRGFLTPEEHEALKADRMESGEDDGGSEEAFEVEPETEIGEISDPDPAPSEKEPAILSEDPPNLDLRETDRVERAATEPRPAPIRRMRFTFDDDVN